MEHVSHIRHPHIRHPKHMKVIWAIDPFEEIEKSHRNTAQTIRYLQKTRKAEVIPVFVLKAPQDQPPDFKALWMSDYEHAALKAVERYFKDLKISLKAEPQVLLQESVSMKDLVDSLIHFSAKVEADLILVTRHAKKGFRSLLLGSFSETLLFRSSVPVMLVGDRVQKFHDSRHILFPTEMGSRAYQLFKRVLKISADFQMGLTVFHSIEPPTTSPLTYDTAAPLIPSRKAEVHSIHREEERIRRKLESWNRIAEREGVQMDYVLDSTSGGVWKKILKLAAIRKTSLVIMEAHSEPFSSILLGSVTRQVVREAPCPVWILKPKASAHPEIHPGTAQAA